MKYKIIESLNPIIGSIEISRYKYDKEIDRQTLRQKRKSC